MRLRHLSFSATLLLAPAVAGAHPHQWIDVASEIMFDGQGGIEAIRHHWRFDEGFSAFALQGLDVDGDGRYSAEELKPLAQENVESLGEYDFFTFVTTGDYQAGFAAPRDSRLDLDAGRLTLHYTLPLAQPLFTRGEVLLQVYDPEYYIAFAMPSAEAVRLVGAPAGCRLQVTPAAGPDAQSAAALATIGPDQRELPADMQALAGGIDNSATVNCGGPTVAAAGNGAREPQTAGDAARDLAQGGSGPEGDLTAPAAPAAVPEAPAPDPLPSAPATTSAGSFMARLAALQANFQRQLTATLKELKAGNAAFWWLGSLSFLYGIVHAAGPGHGKVVISSYLLANEERVRRGVGIAFLSAFVQALVAIGIVGLMAAILGMTSSAMTSTAGALETGSFALVLGLGLYLLVTKGRRAWAAYLGGVPASHHANHAHVEGASRVQWAEGSVDNAGHAHHSASCGCHHHAHPAALDQRGAGGVLAAVLSVGLRPCSGALIVLVFALAQGIFWAGVASTFLMALGTAITVAALAALAVGAKDIAQRLAGGGGSRRSGRVMLALELVAALLLTVLGGTLLVGSLAA